jgi:hypothetical protein
LEPLCLLGANDQKHQLISTENVSRQLCLCVLVTFVTVLVLGGRNGTYRSCLAFTSALGGSTGDIKEYFLISFCSHEPVLIYLR